MRSEPVPRLDPLFVRATFAWPNWAAASVSSIALAVGFGTGWLPVGRPGAVVAIFGAWPLVYAIVVHHRERFLRDASALGATFRALVFAHAFALTLAPAAAAPADACVWWAAPFLVVPCFAQLAPMHPSVFTAAGLALPLRLLLGPPVDGAARVLYPLGVTALLALSHALLSAKRLAHARRERASASAAARAAAAVAMDLHDRLSGIAMLCRVRAEDRGASRALLADEVRAFVRGLGSGQPRDLADLERFASAVGVELAMTRASMPLGEDEASRACVEIATEVVANEARHGTSRRVELVLSGDAAAIRMALRPCVDPSSPSSGRGLRNIARRAADLEGGATWDAGTSTLSITLARPARARVWASLWALELVAHLLPAALVLAMGADVATAMAFALGSLFVGLVQIANARRAGAALTAASSRDRAAVERALPGARAHAEASLSAALARLETAKERAVEDFAEHLGRLIDELEALAEAPASADEAAPERGDHGLRAGADA